MTEELYAIANELMAFLKTHQNMFLREELDRHVSKSLGIDSSKIIYMIAFLVDKGIISKLHGYKVSNLVNVPDRYYLSDKGWLYETFEKFIEDEKMNMELQKRQIQSVIDANKSVENTNTAIQNNIPVQRRQTRISIWVGIFSALFILITVYQTLTDTTSKELKGIKEELQKLQKDRKAQEPNPVRIPDSTLKDTGKDLTNK